MFIFLVLRRFGADLTDYVSSIARSDATPTRRRKMKRSVATIDQMKESVVLKNRRQIDNRLRNRRQVGAKSTKSENREHLMFATVRE